MRCTKRNRAVNLPTSISISLFLLLFLTLSHLLSLSLPHLSLSSNNLWLVCIVCQFSLGLLFLPFSRCPFHITFSRFCCLLSGVRARLVLHSNCAYASHDNCISHSYFVVVLVVVAPTKQSCDICAEKKKRIIKLARAANYNRNRNCNCNQSCNKKRIFEKLCMHFT